MKDLTQGKEWKQILIFAIPMLLGNIFQQGYNIIDSIIVGNYLGKEAVAAIGASFPIIFMLISLIMGFVMGSTIIIAQYFGAKDYVNVKKTIDTLFIVLFFASFVVAGIGIAFNEGIFRLLKIPPEVISHAKLYLTVYFAGIIFLFGFQGVSAVLRGMGDSKTPLYFLIIATLLNIALELLLIIVFKFGIVGVSIATIISQGLSFLAAVLYLNKYHKIIDFHISKLTFDKNIFYQSLRIGVPSGLQQTFVALGMMALMGVVAMFGTSTIAAYTIASRIDSFAFLPAMNFSMALSTFVGQNLGANKHDRVKKGYKYTFLMTSAISIVVSVIVIFFSRQLMSVFTPDVTVIDIGVKYLIIVGCFYIIFSTMFINNGILRGAGDTLIPMFITLCSLWLIRLPLSYILSKYIGITGIWWSIPIAWFIGMTFSYIYYLSGRWKKKVVVKIPSVPLQE